MFNGGYDWTDNPLITYRPPDEPLITGLESGTGGTQEQGQGESAETPVPFDWDVLLGQVWRASGTASTQAQAVTDAKAKIATLPAGSYGIVVRQGGATVYEENVEAGEEKKKEGEGEAEEEGEGEGQTADMAFRYRLTGFKWTWDDKTAADPRLWKGHGAESDISATDYTYGSADDALNAGKAAGDANTAVMRVFAESNYPTQFAGKQFTYSDRLTAATNAGAKEADDAYNEYIKTGDLNLPPGPPGDLINFDDFAGMAASVLVCVAIVILGYHFVKGAL